MSDVGGILANQVRGLGLSWSAAWSFRGELKPHRRALGTGLVAALGFTVARVAEPWPLKWIFDYALAGHTPDTAWPTLNSWLAGGPLQVTALAVAVIVGLAVVRGMFDAWQVTITSQVGYRVLAAVRERTFAHLQRLPLAYHVGSRTGDLLTRLMNDVQVLRDVLVSSLFTLTTEVLVLAGFLLVMLRLDAELTVWALLVVPAILGLLLIYGSRIRQATRDQRRREGQLASRFQQVLTGIHVVQIFAREADEDARVRALDELSVASGMAAARLEAQLTRGVELTLALGTAATVGFGTWRVLGGYLSTGDLIVFMAYVGSFYKPLRRIAAVAERGSKAATCIERIQDVLDAPMTVADGPATAPRFQGALRFDGVSFAYAPGVPVLQGIDLVVPAGQTVALVGPSGAGKSTLLGLLPRLYDPDAGAVRIDGHDARRFSLASLRRQISVVPQDGMLFGGTIRENIAYGRPEATEAEMVAAARAAQIHDFIASLPAGYDTPVGERGVTLSGGQRQRLAIARAILKDAPIVLLDEPTTGLDAESEQLVMAAMDRLLTGRTALVIAHRLATIREADQIVVLEDGQIVEQGNHAALMTSGGRYRSLSKLQLEERPALPRRQVAS